MELTELYILNMRNNFLILSTIANEEEDEIVMRCNLLDYKVVEKLIYKWNTERDQEYLKLLFKYKI